jgi:hypothetical protein
MVSLFLIRVNISVSLKMEPSIFMGERYLKMKFTKEIFTMDVEKEKELDTLRLEYKMGNLIQILYKDKFSIKI